MKLPTFTLSIAYLLFSASALFADEAAKPPAAGRGQIPTILTLDLNTIFDTNPKTIEEQQKIEARRNQWKKDELNGKAETHVRLRFR